MGVKENADICPPRSQIPHTVTQVGSSLKLTQRGSEEGAHKLFRSLFHFTQHQNNRSLLVCSIQVVIIVNIHLLCDISQLWVPNLRSWNIG